MATTNMATDLTSVLTILTVKNCGGRDDLDDPNRCAVCFQTHSAMSESSTQMSCQHGVCKECHNIIRSNLKPVVCLKCQIRSVSPTMSSEEPADLRLLSSYLIQSSDEKREIVEGQIKKLKHLDDVIYKPLLRHYEHLRSAIKQGTLKKIQRIESKFDELSEIMLKRKRKLIAISQNSEKSALAVIENQRNSAKTEAVRLRAFCKTNQAQLMSKHADYENVSVSKFVEDVNQFESQARRTSTKNSSTHLHEIEIETDPDAERAMKNALQGVITPNEVERIHPSRIGTPTSSPVSSIAESNSSPPSVPSLEVLLTPCNPSSRRSNNRRATRNLPRRPETVSPRPSSAFYPSVSPRQLRSAGDGCDALADHEARRSIPGELSSIADTTSRQILPSLAHPQRNSLTRHSNNTSSSENARSKESPCLRLRSCMEERLKQARPGRRLVDQKTKNLSMVVPSIKYETFQDHKLERPNGVCRSSSAGGDEIYVADCGSGKLVRAAVNGEVIHAFPVWRDDGDSAKAHGVFDVTDIGNGCLIVSDSHQKKVVVIYGNGDSRLLDLPPNTDPRGTVSDDHAIYICDHGNQCVQTTSKISCRQRGGTEPEFKTVFLGLPNDQLPIRPYFIAVNRRDGRVLVTDHGNGLLILARADNSEPPRQIKLEVPSANSYEGAKSKSHGVRPTGVAWLPDGLGAVIANEAGHNLLIVDDGMNVCGTYGRQGGGEGEFNFPQGMIFTTNDVLAVCDMNNARMQFIKLDDLLACTEQSKYGQNP